MLKSTLVVPTYKREKALGRALQSVYENTLLPDELLIIDDANLPKGFIEKWQEKFKNKLNFKYYKKDHNKHRRGLSESKNLAVQLAENEIIFFIDDDVVLDKNYIKEIMHVWKSGNENKLAAVGGRISNNRSQSDFEKKVYNKFFGLSSKLPWDVNDVAFQVWDESVSEPILAHYIHGGVSSYKKDILIKYPFREFSGGRTGLEDVEHALRLKLAGYHFIYNPKASLEHHHEALGREKPFLSGKKESQNRKEIFKLHCKQDFKYKMRFTWANVGWILRKILALRFSYATGMLYALLISDTKGKN